MATAASVYQYEEDDILPARFENNFDAAQNFLLHNLLKDRLKLAKANNPQREPRPTPTKREDIFRRSDFQFIETEQLRNLIPSAKDTFRSFAAKVTAGCTTDEQKCWAIYYWMSNADSERIFTSCFLSCDGGQIPNGPLELAKKKFAGCLTMFEELASASGLMVKIITGYSKTESDGKFVTSGGSWCAVFVQNEWRFVDPKFGCFKLSNHQSASQLPIGPDGQIQQGSANEGELVRGLDESRFFRDPELTVQERCAEDPKWQLLTNPLTKRDFEELVYTDWPFKCVEDYNLLRIDSHPKGVAATDVNGCLKLTFGNKVGTAVSLALNWCLTKNRKDIPPAIIDTDGRTVELSQFLYSWDMQMGEYAVQFNPPMQGKYLLQILVRNIPMYSYIVHCPKPNPRQYPQVGTYGATIHAEKMGVTFANLNGAELGVANGKSKLCVQHRGDIIYETCLKGCTEQRQEDMGRIEEYHDVVEGLTTTHFMVIVHSRQVLALVLKASSPTMSQQQVGAFLIDGTNAPVSTVPEPIKKEFHGRLAADLPDDLQLGMINEDSCNRLAAVPMNCLERVNKVNKCKKTMKWKTNASAKISYELFYLKKKKYRKQTMDYISLSHRLDADSGQQTWDFRMKFVEFGYYTLKLFELDSKNSKTSNLFYCGLFLSKDAPKNVRPFAPTLYPGIEVVQPESKFLKPDKNEEVVIRAPKNVKSIAFVNQKHEALFLQKDNNEKNGDLFKAKVNPGKLPLTLTFMANLTNGKTEKVAELVNTTEDEEQKLRKLDAERIKKWREETDKEREYDSGIGPEIEEADEGADD